MPERSAIQELADALGVDGMVGGPEGPPKKKRPGQMIEIPLAQYEDAVRLQRELLMALEEGYDATRSVYSTTRTVIGNPKCGAGLASSCNCPRCRSGSWNVTVSDRLEDLQNSFEKHEAALVRLSK